MTKDERDMQGGACKNIIGFDGYIPFPDALPGCYGFYGSGNCITCECASQCYRAYLRG